MTTEKSTILSCPNELKLKCQICNQSAKLCILASCSDHEIKSEIIFVKISSIKLMQCSGDQVTHNLGG